jgi:hypothetical protein
MTETSKLVASFLAAGSVIWLACGNPGPQDSELQDSGAQAPQEVLAAVGCQENNPFACKVIAEEKVPGIYRDGTGRETEAWCLVFQAGNLSVKSSVIYLATTTDGKAWLPEFGGKAKLEQLGCAQAAQKAPGS